MGIRYDRDENKITNGPVIFFTGFNSDDSLRDAINVAFEKGLNFFAYREPDDLSATFCSSEDLVSGLGTPGFVISMFDPDLPFITIPFENDKSKSFEPKISYEMPSRSTLQDVYEEEVKEIINGIEEKRWEKIVSSRVLLKSGSYDLGNIFTSLCEERKNAFVFCFATKPTGCWIGASPELLLKGNKGNLETMALAGTRIPAYSVSDEWNEKNLKEQNLVTGYIQKVFRKHNITITEEETGTKEAGPVEHICTRIKAKANFHDGNDLSTFLKEFSPTPALCGIPKQEALDFILSHEQFSRGCYGGFCGPFHGVENFLFHVTLRCCCFSRDKVSLYAGGGITADSVPEDEWNETEAKLETLTSIIDNNILISNH